MTRILMLRISQPRKPAGSSWLYNKGRSENQSAVGHKNHLTDVTPPWCANVDIARPDECIDAMNEVAPGKPWNDG